MRLFSTSDNLVPEPYEVFDAQLDHSVHLRVARWRPDGKARGTVILLHGRGEAIEKYFETIGDFLKRQFCVVSFDWRGQGLSSRLLKNPAKGHIAHFDHYLQDLDYVMRHYVLPDCPRPYLMVAHSMGAAIGLLALREGRTRYDRAILSSPLIGLSYRFMPQGRLSYCSVLLKMLGLSKHFVPGGSSKLSGTEPFKNNKQTSDQKRYERYAHILQAFPELGIGAPTIGWLYAACHAIENFKDVNFLQKVRVPMLVLVGLKEQIVCVSAIERLSTLLPSAHLVRIAGARHEIMMEADRSRDIFWAAFDGFMEEI